MNAYSQTECIYNVTAGIETNDKFCAGRYSAEEGIVISSLVYHINVMNVANEL